MNCEVFQDIVTSRADVFALLFLSGGDFLVLILVAREYVSGRIVRQMRDMHEARVETVGGRNGRVL